MPDFPPLECQKSVYRTVFRKEWVLGEGRFKWQAFKPYFADASGVSTFIEQADIDAHAEQPYFGVLSVKVGRTRDCSCDDFALDVVQNETWHANITGIPFHYLEDGTEDSTLKAKMLDACTALRDKAARLL